MLELRRVSKHFSSIPAVDDISFSARPGEVTGYLGPNGSGKSTTMKMITGLIEMTFGDILFDGKPIQEDLIAYKRRMGYVPEEPYLYTHLSGTEYLTMVTQLRDLPTRESSDRIDGLLRLLSLHDDRHASISGYSKGMRQKILIAAALLHNPELILLDEPFSGLDVASSLVLRSLIQELASPRSQPASGPSTASIPGPPSFILKNSLKRSSPHCVSRRTAPRPSLRSACAAARQGLYWSQLSR
jgi:ABC-2 type transport system ATP-binding protein